MAPYGKGQMLGSQIDPRLMAVDYSPFVNAANMAAQSQINLASSIGSTIEKGVNQFTDYKKQQAEDERMVQKSKSVAKAIGDLIPDLQPTIQESMMILDDKEVPLSRRKAEAEAISDILNLGINEVRNRQEIGLKERQLGMQQAESIDRYSDAENQRMQEAMKRVPKKFSVGNMDVVVQEDGLGNIYDPQTDIPIVDLQNYIIGGKNWAGGMSGTDVGLPQGDAAKSIDEASVLLGADFPDGVPVDGEPLVTQVPTLNGEPKVEQTVFTPRGLPRSQEKEQETFRPFNQEEIALYGSPGQVNVQSGRVYPIRPPSGTQFKTNPDGSVEFIQGVDISKLQKAEKSKMAAESLVDQNMQDLYFLEDRTKDMAEGVTGAAGRVIAEKVYTTEQAENKAVIDRIASRLTLGTLQSMRENSPTGGALGNVSDKDIQILKNSATSLSNAQSPREFQRELVRLQNLQYELVHGTESVLKRKLANNEITQEQFDLVQSNRPKRYLGSRGELLTREITPSREETAAEKLRKKIRQ